MHQAERAYAERLAKELERLFDTPGLLAGAAAKAKSMAEVEAVSKLADLAEELAREKWSGV